MGSGCLAMCVRVLSSLFSFIVVQERRERGGERERGRVRVRLLFLFGLPVQRVWAKRQVSGSHAFYPNRFSAAVWKWAAES